MVGCRWVALGFGFDSVSFDILFRIWMRIGVASAVWVGIRAELRFAARAGGAVGSGTEIEDCFWLTHRHSHANSRG